jgi:hypothetical protein
MFEMGNFSFRKGDKKKLVMTTVDSPKCVLRQSSRFTPDFGFVENKFFKPALDLDLSFHESAEILVRNHFRQQQVSGFVKFENLFKTSIGSKLNPLLDGGESALEISLEWVATRPSFDYELYFGDQTPEKGKWTICECSNRLGFLFPQFSASKDYIQNPWQSYSEDYETIWKVCNKSSQDENEKDFLYFYHLTDPGGVHSIIQRIDLSHSKIREKRDFSREKGFYLSNSLSTIYDSIAQKLPFLSGGIAIIRFSVNRKELQKLRGSDLSKDMKIWKKVVETCRAKDDYDSKFYEDEVAECDYLEGPIAIQQSKNWVPSKGYQMCLRTPAATKLFSRSITSVLFIG